MAASLRATGWAAEECEHGSFYPAEPGKRKGRFRGDWYTGQAVNVGGNCLSWRRGKTKKLEDFSARAYGSVGASRERPR